MSTQSCSLGLKTVLIHISRVIPVFTSLKSIIFQLFKHFGFLCFMSAIFFSLSSRALDSFISDNAKLRDVTRDSQIATFSRLCSKITLSISMSESIWQYFLKKEIKFAIEFRLKFKKDWSGLAENSLLLPSSLFHFNQD